MAKSHMILVSLARFVCLTSRYLAISWLRPVTITVLWSETRWIETVTYKNCRFSRYPPKMSFFKKMGQPRSLFCLFLVFSSKQYNFSTNQCKKVHPVYGTRIQTHNLSNMSRHPIPLEQGSRPKVSFTTSTTHVEKLWLRPSWF